MKFLVSLIISFAAISFAQLPDVRPPQSSRTFSSPAIDNLIDSLRPLFIDPDLGTLLSNCLPNTLDTTVYSFTKRPLDTFIITGDISALWLRDSANQVIPYLPYAPEDENLSVLINGLIKRHASSVLLDSFANAFNYNDKKPEGHQTDKRTPPMTWGVFEGKYEIDSLAAFLKLSYWHFRYSGDDALLEFGDLQWVNAVERVVDTIETMQKDDGQSANPPYLFQRETSEALDTLSMQGRGPPCRDSAFSDFLEEAVEEKSDKMLVRPVAGLSRSLFRPSDDAVTMSHNIPGNAMACVELAHSADVLKALVALSKNASTASSDTLSVKAGRVLGKVDKVRWQICKDLLHYTKPPRTSSAGFGIVPYEVDGFGGELFMDDANIPSLLSLPILGYISTESKAYQATRKFVLSKRNPFFYSGSAGEGVGGPHEGPNMAWPMSIIVRALTSQDDEEIQECLNLIVASSAGTGLMHESFNVNDASDFTRPWFAWANGLLGELLLSLVAARPQLLIRADAVAQAQALVRTPVALQAQREALVN